MNRDNQSSLARLTEEQVMADKLQNSPADQEPEKTDPLLQLIGSGRRIWVDEHTDDYVKRLRDGWEQVQEE